MKITNAEISNEILNYLEEGNHIFDNNKLKLSNDVVEEISRNILRNKFNFDDNQIEEAHDHINNEYKAVRKENRINKVKAAVLPNLLLFVSLLLSDYINPDNYISNLVPIKNFVANNQYLSQIFTSSLFLGAGITSGLYESHRYFTLTRKQPFEDMEIGKTKYTVDKKVNKVFSKLKSSGTVKDYGYGR